MSSVDFIVRQANSAADVRSAADLLIRFFQEDGFTTPENVIVANTAKLASLPTCGLFVAFAGEEAIGVASVSMEFGIEYGWSGEMGDLYVVPDRRGGGVAAALVRAVENFLVAHGATGYQVTVAPHGHETALKNFYAKLGFDHEGRHLLFKTFAAKSQA